MIKKIALIIISFVFLAIGSCKMKTNNESIEFIDEICSIAPGDWNCKVIDNNFDSIPLFKGFDNPETAIEFSDSKNGSSPIFLYVYDISKKDNLEKLIHESMKEANCVPVFFGENKKYYVVTSSCYVNSNFFSDNKNLKPALIKLFTKYYEGIVK